MEAYKRATPVDEHQSTDQPFYRLTDHALSITVDHGQLCLSGRVTHVGLGLELWSLILDPSQYLGPPQSILLDHSQPQDFALLSMPYQYARSIAHSCLTLVD